MDNYWTATDDIIRANGGQNPICPDCGQVMIPIDDHGRFSCGCPPLFGPFGHRHKHPSVAQPEAEIQRVMQEIKEDIASQEGQ